MTRNNILRLLETYFRHRWLYILPFVLMIGLGAAYILTDTPKFQSKGVVYVRNESLLSSLNDVRSSDTSWWATPAETISGELNEFFQTDAFIRAIISKSALEASMAEGPEKVEEVLEETREAIWAYPVGDNQVVVAVAHENPLVAYELVSAAIESYIQWHINAQRSESEAAEGFFSDIIVRYGNDLEVARQEMRQYLFAHPDPISGERPDLEQVDIQRLQGAIDMAAERYTSALAKEEEAQLAQAQIESDARQNYMLIDAPVISREPELSYKDMAVKMGVFVAAGLFISATALFGATLLDHTFRFPFDVESRLEVPVLATLRDSSERTGARRRSTASQDAATGIPAGMVAQPAANNVEDHPGQALEPST